MPLFSFLLGIGSGIFVFSNGTKVRRTLARAVVKGTDVALTVGKEAQRISALFVEDIEDARAEVREEEIHKKEEAATVAELREQIRQMKAEVEALHSKSKSDHIQ